jgi:hypothetical protein
MAHTRTSNDDLRVIQPKATALTNIGVKTATDTATQVPIRRVRASGGPKGTSTVARRRLDRRT